MAFPKLRNFKIERKICKRHCYTVYEGQEIKTGAKKSIKTLDPKLATDRMTVYNFLNSARISRLLKNDQALKIDYYGKNLDQYIIVSEPNDLKPLSLYIHEQYPIPFDQVLDVVLRICRILRDAHLRGIVHGLLNPSSIFISNDGLVQVDDFCYQWLASSLLELEDAEALYLSYHISPEVHRGETIDGRADMYSLGVIFLQLLTDYVPFNYFDQVTVPTKRLNISMATLKGLLPHYPKRLQQVMAYLLQPRPENRFPNFKILEKKLEVLMGEPTPSASLAEEVASH